MSQQKSDLDVLMDMYKRLYAMSDVQVIHSPLTPIPDLFPHYTDKRFDSPRTVYLADGYKTENGWLSGDEWVVRRDFVYAAPTYAYDDRLRQWHGYDAAEYAGHVAEKQIPEYRCAAHIEVYLRELMRDKSLKLIHILAGVNHSNGYPYCVYGYISNRDDYLMLWASGD